MSRKKPTKTQEYDKLVESLTRKIDELEREVKRLRKASRTKPEESDESDSSENKPGYNDCDDCGKGEIVESKFKLRNGQVRVLYRCNFCGPLGPNRKKPST